MSRPALAAIVPGPVVALVGAGVLATIAAAALVLVPRITAGAR